jgi:spoIIIJ-associated protein
VRRKGRPRMLEPMNPADRRIVHMTLADDPGVVTESSGDGYFKRVSIRPA